MPAVKKEQGSQGSFDNFSDLMPGGLDTAPSSAPRLGIAALATAEQQDDAEAQMEEAQLQLALFGSSRSEVDAEAWLAKAAESEPQGEPPGGPPQRWSGWESQSSERASQGGPPGGFAAKPPGESLPTSLQLDDEFADALLAASTGELGGDMTSSEEIFPAELCHVTCVADESLVIRYNGLGDYPSLPSRTSPIAVTSEGMRSMLKGVAPGAQMIKGFAPAEDEASEVPECASCWGAQLHFNGDAACTPDFVPGKLHFKNKFCHNCKEGILVPLAQVRAASAELAACFVNKRSEGFWNNAPKSMGGGQYRILNNTAGSIGPRLALFRDQPPEFQWLPVPDHWITDDGCVRLCVAKGTLVPSKTLRCGHSQGVQATYKRRISNVAPTDSPSSFRPTQVPCSSLSDRPSAAAYAQHQAVGAGQDIANMSAQHVQRQAKPAGSTIVSSQATFQSSRHLGVQGGNTEEYNSKVKEYETQLQTLQKLQAQLLTMQGGLQGDMRGGPQGGLASAPSAVPGLNMAAALDAAVKDEEAGMESQLQLALFGAAAGVEPPSPLPVVSTRPSPRSFVPRSPLSGAVVIPARAPDEYHTPDGYTPEEFADALLDGDETTDEFGIDMASAIETWKANQAADGVADESLDVSRASTVCRGLQGMGLDREQMLADELEQAENLFPNALCSSTARSSPIPEGVTEYDW